MRPQRWRSRHADEQRGTQRCGLGSGWTWRGATSCYRQKTSKKWQTPL